MQKTIITMEIIQVLISVFFFSQNPEAKNLRILLENLIISL